MNDLVVADGVPRELALVSQAKLALIEARSIDDVKNLRDKAEAMRVYLKQRDESLEAQNIAAEIKLWAERRAGEMLIQMPKNSGSKGKGVPSHDVSTPRLGDLGVEHHESSRWQQIASVPEDEFEEHIQETKANGKELTTSGVLKKVKDKKFEDRRQKKRVELVSRAAVAPGIGDQSWEIVEGDCLQQLGKIEPGSVRLVFADPPYNIGIDYGDHMDDLRPAAEFLPWCRRWIESAARALTPDGSLWVLINHEWAADVELLIRDAGLRIRSWITWFESFGVNCSNNFNRTSRRLLYAVRDPSRIVFRDSAVRRPSDRQLVHNDKRANPEGKIWDDVWGITPAIPRLVGTAKERIPDFPTQLPLSLLRPIIGCASEPGDLIVDPFNGSGTTGEAAIRLGRRYLGIELSPEFARMARLRLQAASGEVHAQG